MKNLIRNGGFERGNVDFWTGYDCAALGVTGSPTYKGSYAGSLTCDNVNKPYIMPNDFIALTEGETAFFEAWVRPSHSDTVSFKAKYYDEGLTEIAELTYESLPMAVGSWHNVMWALTGVRDAVYVKPLIEYNAVATGKYLLIDNVLMYKFDRTQLTGLVLSMEEQSGISSAGTIYGDYMIAFPYREVEFSLYVATSAGAAETLDVTIESYIGHGIAMTKPIVTFEQVTAGADYQVVVLSEGLGSKIRTKSVIGGAPTDITYNVVAKLKA